MFERQSFVAILAKRLGESTGVISVTALSILIGCTLFAPLAFFLALMTLSAQVLQSVIVGCWFGYAFLLIGSIIVLEIIDARRTRACINFVLHGNPTMNRYLHDSQPEMWDDVDAEAGYPPKAKKGTHLLRVVK